MSKKKVFVKTPDNNNTVKTEQGVVVSRFGAEADIELRSGRQIRCHLRRKLETLVCGDEILCEIVDDDKGIVVEHLPRRTVLKRPIRYQGLKAVAANIDQICIVVSPEPDFSTLVLDKYLVVCEQAKIPPVIIFNKSDRLQDYPFINDQLQVYKSLGYPILMTSVVVEQGLKQLVDVLCDKISVFVGQSGVGKTSIAKLLLPQIQPLVGEISTVSGLGMHTTTASRLYHLIQGGSIIDSPGIREFSLEHIDPPSLAAGYLEIQQASQFCKYRNCIHINEPHCHVKELVTKGLIDQGRYQRYLKLMEEN